MNLNLMRLLARDVLNHKAPLLLVRFNHQLGQRHRQVEILGHNV